MHIKEAPGGPTLGSVPEVRHSDDANNISLTQAQTLKRNSQTRSDKPLSQPQRVCPEQHMSRLTHGSSQSVAPVEARRRGEEVRGKARLRIASKKQVVKSTAGNEGILSEGVNIGDLVLSPRGKEATEMSNTGVTHHEKNDETRNIRTGKEKYENTPLFIDSGSSKRGYSTEKSDDERVPPRYQLPSVEERLQVIKEERERRLDKMQEKLVSENAKTVAPRPKVLTRVKYGVFKAIPGRRAPNSSSSSSILAIGDGSLSEPQLCGVRVEDGRSTTFSGASSSFSGTPMKMGSSQQPQMQTEEKIKNVEMDDLMDRKSEESPLMIEKDD
ncbi:hypothetical protein LSM04_004097 [Trypanosoma melophagium]|uniref:uncharacterized protein n=1 Tax=Trypanosoma melophagium TaxID=715481 RepID=UPI00351A4C50|nr:hypothetical protein LSM04_004097 [Trypanosoma melophagium]